MKCPRCGNEWDTNKGSCSRCGYVVRMTGKPGGSTTLSPDPFSPGELKTGGLAAEKQQSGDLPNPWQQSAAQAPAKQHSGNLSNPWQQFARQHPVKQQSGDLPNSWQQSTGLSSANRQSGTLSGPLQQPGPVTPVNQPPGGFSTPQVPLPTTKPQYGDMPAGRQQSGGLPSLPSSPRPAQVPVPPKTPDMASNTTFASDSTLAKPAFEKNSLNRMPPEKEFNPRPPLQQTWSPAFDAPSMKNNIPSTSPSVQPFEVNQSINTSRLDPNHRQSQPLPPQSIDQPVIRGAQNTRTPRPPTTSQQLTGTPAPVQSNTLVPSSRPLLPGVLLRGGRYRMQELIERQDWLSGVFEATWIGKDSRRDESQVMICEVVLPESTSVMTQSILRTATMALASIGRHPHIPTLWDAFSDQGRSFFVFEPIDGESLLSRLRHSGRTMAESEVIDCCLQMTEVLELLAQQSPPMVHGLIRPEHIIMVRNASQFMLTNFSVVLAGGATQFITGMDRSRLSPYASPEFVRGVIDVRTDLYSLIATAYHAVTGSVPGTPGGTIPSAQRLNNNVSTEFDAILTKGLRAIANQRYQRLSELRQDLLSLRSVSGTLVSGSNGNGPGSRIASNAIAATDLRNGQHSQYAAPPVPQTVAEALPIRLATTADNDEGQTLLPPPEDLPPLEASNDKFNAILWLGLIILVIIIVTVLSRIQH